VSISVLLPTYNEKGNIEVLLSKLISINEINEIIIIDDGSKDSTVDTVLKFISISKKVRLIERHRKLGLGSAYIEGFFHAKGDYIVTMDADLSHLPSYIKIFLKRLNEKKCDIIIGSRHIKGGYIIGWKFHRYFVHFIANILARIFLLINCSDITSGFRLYKRQVLANIIKFVKSKGFSFQLETLFLAKKFGYKVEEEPIIFYNRKLGKSKFNMLEALEFFLSLFKILKTYKAVFK